MASSGPFKFTLTILHVVFVLADVQIGVIRVINRLLPDTFTLFLTVGKDSAIRVTIRPPVLANSLSNAVLVFAQVDVSVRKNIRALTVAQ
jgi:hypothetical protein